MATRSMYRGQDKVWRKELSIIWYERNGPPPSGHSNPFAVAKVSPIDLGQDWVIWAILQVTTCATLHFTFSSP
jgi:hypothetical protein